MHNKLENILVGVIGLLLVVIVGLIVKYQLQKEEIPKTFAYQEAPVEPVSKKEKTNKYLENLEGYSDIDVKVDPKKEDKSNVVKVIAETSKDDLAVVIEDRSKSSYMKNLENYTDSETESKKSQSKSSVLKEEEPVKLEKEGIVDEIGMAIDAALSD
jgi:cell division protein FtsN